MLPARLDKRHIPLVYRLVAPTHDLAAKILESKARSLGLELLSIADGEAFLEVAVGTGLSFTRVLRANTTGINVGIDLSPAMLNRAKRKVQKIGAHAELLVGDAYQLPFESESFDALLNSYMFDLLPEDDFPGVLSEFFRVLRPGGRLVMMNLTTAESTPQKLWDTIYSIYPPLLGGCRGVRVSPALKTMGFSEIQRTFIVQNSFPSEVIHARRP